MSAVICGDWHTTICPAMQSNPLLWNDVRMSHLEEWFRSWVHGSVYSAGGRSSVEAWYTSAVGIEEVLSGVVC